MKRSRGGYGLFWLDGRSVLAHRWGFREYVGALADDEMVRHTCDNPPCQNPSHWLRGDHRSNSTDMLERDRSSHGERRYCATLTVEQVHRVRELWTHHYYRGLGRDLCAEYGVSKMVISNIVRGKTWRRD